MAVKIRLSRIGRTHRPYYRMVAIDSRAKRDGQYLDNLGTFDPFTKKFVQFHASLIEKWVAVGAIISDSAKKLIRAHGQKPAAPKVAKKKAESDKAATA